MIEQCSPDFNWFFYRKAEGVSGLLQNVGKRVTDVHNSTGTFCTFSDQPSTVNSVMETLEKEELPQITSQEEKQKKKTI